MKSDISRVWPVFSKFYPEMCRCAPQHQKILPREEAVFVVAHVPIAAGMPPAATSSSSSLSTSRLRGGRSRPSRRRVCGLSPSPRALLLPDLSDADDKVRIAPGSGRRGIAPTMGSPDAFAPALVFFPLLAMPPFDSVAAVAAATTTTIKTKAMAAAAAARRRR